jgi:hypothetical protein
MILITHKNLRIQLNRILFISVILLLALPGAYSQSFEYEMKAVALEKFAIFIDWPEGTFESSKNDFVIAVLGKDPFGYILEQVYKNHKIKEREVKIVFINDIDQLPECQMLFIPKVKKNALLKILNHVKTLPVLTVSDTEGYALEGCFINFFNFDGKLRFEINQKAMKLAGFNVDYKLLRVAKIINS